MAKKIKKELFISILESQIRRLKDELETCLLIPARFCASCVHDNIVKLTMGSVKEEGYK